MTDPPFFSAAAPAGTIVHGASEAGADAAFEAGGCKCAMKRESRCVLV